MAHVGIAIPGSRTVFQSRNPGISGLEFPVMSCVEKYALLLKYKLYYTSTLLLRELAGLKAALISIKKSVQRGALVAQSLRLRLVRYSDSQTAETVHCPVPRRECNRRYVI